MRSWAQSLTQQQQNKTGCEGRKKERKTRWDASGAEGCLGVPNCSTPVFSTQSLLFPDIFQSVCVVVGICLGMMVHKLAIPVLGRLRQEHCNKFKTSVGYRVRLYLKTSEGSSVIAKS